MRRMTASQERTFLRGVVLRTHARLEEFMLKVGGRGIDGRAGWAIVESLRKTISELGIGREAGERRNPS